MARKIINLVGQSFGRLTVIGIDKTKKIRPTRWFCLCECGTTVSIRRNCLIEGITKSCGCLKRETLVYYQKMLTLPPHAAAKNLLYYRYYKSADTRYIDFLLDFDEFIALTQQPCFYCGAIPANVCN